MRGVRYSASLRAGGTGKTARDRAVVRSFGSSTRFRFIFFSNAVGGRDLWSDWKNGIYIGSVAIGVLLPLFFFVVRP